MKLAAAANTEIPAYLALLELGYQIEVQRNDDREAWKATDSEHELLGRSPLDLLALAKLIECRGENWRANDSEIDEFLRRYGE